MRALLLLICLAIPGHAMADRIVCDDPVDNVARMGIPASLNYSLTEDDDEKECRFSIEGVAAGSPPEELLRDAANRIRGREQLFRLAEANPFDLLEAVALLLASASPVDSADESIMTAENAALLQECVFVASEPGQFFVGFNSDGAFSCSVLGPDDLGAFNDSVSGGSVRLEALDAPRLILRNRRDTLTEYLFLRTF